MCVSVYVHVGGVVHMQSVESGGHATVTPSVLSRAKGEWKYRVGVK